MRNILTSLLLGFVVSNAWAQTKVDLNNKSLFIIVDRTAESTVDNGRTVFKMNEAEPQGLAILKNVTFSSGTIELDIQGRNVMQKSFVGIAFHLQDDGHFDAIYFRPFNFMNADTARRRRAVQYVSEPDYPWNRLREEFPGKYENRVIPAPDGDSWFHAKIVVDGKNVVVYVNNSPTPSLQVTRITDTTTGKLALWTGTGSNGNFANLVITNSPKKNIE